MEVTGILKAKSDVQQVSEKFRRRNFVVTIEPTSQYPQSVQFQITQDRVGLIDPVAVGAEVKVFFNLRGREWKNPQGEVKYFNTLEAWRIEATGNTHATSNLSSVVSSPDAQSDDLPF